MVIHWQVRFRSLRSNTLYTVNIYDENHASAPVQLTGADVPFETQEDDTDDVFAPLRTQTGYLRIVDTGKDNDGNPFNWREFIPTTDIDRPVTLTNEEGTVVWMGFMQAQNFGSRLYEVPQEREFPLQCPLTVTSCTDVDITQKQIRNFAYLLLKVIQSIPSVCRPTQFVIQDNPVAFNALLKRIDWQNFITEDSDGNLEPRFNMLQCLEEMCRFWGWTARICGTTLYLMCPDDEGKTPTFLELTYTELIDMVGGTASGTMTVNFTPAGFGSDIFASNDNDDYQMRGPNKAVVTADSGNADGYILETYPQKVLYDMYDLGFVNPGQVQYDYTKDMTVISHPFMSGNCSANASFNVLRLYKNENRDREELIPVVRIKQDYSGNVLAAFETNIWHSYEGGRFHLTCDIYKDGEKFEDPIDNYPYYGNKRMRMRLGIGATRSTAKWFNGVMWDDNETTFIARIGGRDDRIWSTYGSGIWDYEISTWLDLLYGKIFVEFLGSPDLTGGFDIANFKIQFERNAKQGDYKHPDREDKHAFTATGEGITYNSYEAETIFTSYQYSVFGFGAVLDEDFSYYVRIGNYCPEQHLANRIINYWKVARRKIDCELRSDKIIELTPRVVGTIDGTRVYPLSVSHNWRDEVEQVVFIELPEQNTQTAASSSENDIEQQNDIDL